METAQLNRPPSQPTPTDTASLSPEIVEDLPVKIPAGGQHFGFREENPFKAPTHPAKPVQQPAAATLPQTQLDHQLAKQKQPATARKPIIETILIIGFGLILSLATIVMLR